MNIIDEFLSLTNFQRAWLKVAENQGCAGVDNETIEDFRKQDIANLRHLLDCVLYSIYKPNPYKQVLIPKKKGSWRELRIPTVRDRIVQQALLNVLSPLVDSKFSEVSFAYRPNRSYIDAVKKVAHWRDSGYQWVLDADIVQFFDNIDHQRLLKEVRKHLDNYGILCMIKSWISTGTLSQDGIIYPKKGIAQGAVISPLLANIYLDEFDWKIAASDLKLVRYADDFLILSRSQEGIKLAYTEVSQIFLSMGLELHQDKTQITNFEQGFRFLGHGFLEKAIFPIDSPKESAQNSSEQKKTLSAVLSSKKDDFSTILPHSQLDLSVISELIESSSPVDKSKDSVNANLIYHTQSSFFWNSEMATLYLLEQGTTLHKDHLRLIVQTAPKSKIEVLIREVERILVFGNIQLTTPVINTCLQENILILFLNQSGQYNGHLSGLSSSHLEREIVQLNRENESGFKLSISKGIVYGKLINSKRLLQRLNRKRKVAEVEKAILGIDSDIQNIESIDNLDSLRGYEGIAAARYFPAFGQLITNPAFSFSQRNRRPPTDPVNALLSFGYTLLFNNVLSLIIAEGLSPYLGNFHYGERDKPYLAFDLMEEFRSIIVDGMVLRLVNNSLLKPDDFEASVQNGGIYLAISGRRVFLKEFESRMNKEVSHPDIKQPVSYRQVIQLQIRRYKRFLLESVPYQPFLREI